MTDEEREDFTFNLRCLGDYEMREVGDWIYFIHENDLSPEGDGTIWRVRKDGTDLRKLQKSSVQVRGIIGIDDCWIYFAVRPGTSGRGGMESYSPKGKYLKMTLIGGLERNMTASDLTNWSDEIEEMEEAL